MHIVKGSKYCYLTLKSIKQSFVQTQSNDPAVWFQTIHFSSSIWPIYRTLSGATTQGQSGPYSHGNEGLLCTLQSSRHTGASPSDCLVSYPGYLLWWGSLTPQQRCSQCILQSQLTGRGTSLRQLVKILVWLLFSSFIIHYSNLPFPWTTLISWREETYTKITWQHHGIYLLMVSRLVGPKFTEILACFSI